MSRPRVPLCLAVVVSCVVGVGGSLRSSVDVRGVGQQPADSISTGRLGFDTVRVGHARAGGYDVVEVPLDEYVARVVAGEAATRSAPAALEAVAIAVRTFAAANATRHRADGFDLCDSTHCQVMAAATAATREAADRTAGEVLLYEGQAAPVFFSACCGGQSELPEDVWPRARHLPFLERHKEAACRAQCTWTTEISTADLLRALGDAGFTGKRLRGVSVARRTRSGRAATLRLKGLEPGEIGGDALRAAVGRTLGWQLLRSTAFDVDRTRAGYKFSGHGSGHGVGLCLLGARRMADEGQSAERILQEYFPGTTIGTLDVGTSPRSRAKSPYQQMPR